MGGEKGRVCVTGGTGLLGSWLIKTFLENGYSVNATVRYPRPENKKDISYLTNLPGASDHLKIFPADLTDPASLAAAVDGCTGVFDLVRSTDSLPTDTDDEAVISRSTTGTLALLQASLASKTVKRVVYGSSVAAVVHRVGANLAVLDEESWSDVEYLRASKLPAPHRRYALAKTLTEKMALEFGEKHGLEVVSVVASYGSGAFLTPWLPESITVPLAPLFGKESIYPRLFNIKMVHMDDLARAFIFLLECPTAKGRYIVASHHGQFLQMCDYLANRYPDLYQKQSDSYLKGINGPIAPSLSSKKLLDAGFEFKHGIDDMYDDAIRCCKEKGFL